MKAFLQNQKFPQLTRKQQKTGVSTVAALFLSLLIPTVSVAQLAKDKCKFLGNVIATSIPADFKNYWNQVTPENAGKWQSAEPTRDEPNWANLDLTYKYAEDNQLIFKQHTFVWGQQAPSWMGAGTTLTAQEQKDEVEEWMKTFCERYPNTKYIDVVNEPLHAVPNYADALGGAGTTKWDWVVWSFEKARQHCPNAKLLLNDYNILNSSIETDKYLQIVDVLKGKGLIDIIGEQGHFLESTPLATIKANLDKFYERGLPIHITEYDVHIPNDAEQEAKIKEQLAMFWQHPGVQGVTFWGYRQGTTWRTDAYLVRSNNTERPALTWMKTYIPGSTGGTFCFTVGTEDTKVGVNVYPNPAADGRFTIESAFANTEVEILDIHGRRVMNFKLSNEQAEDVQLSTAPGIYILKTINAHGKKIQKLIVQ